jgi:hypothetical protein
MPRYIEIDEKKVKRLMREAQQFQDDIVCAIGTDFMQKIAEAENKMLFDIIKGLENAPTEDAVPRSEVDKADQEIERLKRILNSYALQYGTVTDKQKVIGKAKQEVASEIFEELFRNWREQYVKLAIEDVAELEKKYIGE